MFLGNGIGFRVQPTAEEKAGYPWTGRSKEGEWQNFFCPLACGAGISKHESGSPGGCHNAVVADYAGVSFSGEGGRVVAHDSPGPSAGLEALTC